MKMECITAYPRNLEEEDLQYGTTIISIIYRDVLCAHQGCGRASTPVDDKHACATINAVDMCA